MFTLSVPEKLKNLDFWDVNNSTLKSITWEWQGQSLSTCISLESLLNIL